MTLTEPANSIGQYALIVLDGCDGTGKTTLVRQISAIFGHRVIHSSLSDAGTDLFVRYKAILTSPGPLVLDRSFVSELVYGPLERGTSRLTQEQAAQLAAIVADRQGILVHLTGQPDRITARLQERDGHAPPQAHIHSLIAGYANVFKQLSEHATVLNIDTTTGVHAEFSDEPGF